MEFTSYIKADGDAPDGFVYFSAVVAVVTIPNDGTDASVAGTPIAEGRAAKTYQDASDEGYKLLEAFRDGREASVFYWTRDAVGIQCDLCARDFNFANLPACHACKARVCLDCSVLAGKGVNGDPANGPDPSAGTHWYCIACFDKATDLVAIY